MSSGTPAASRPPRLNPFVFPSDTDFRFVLLVVAVLGASLFIYSLIFFSIPVNQKFYFDTFAHCWDIRNRAGPPLPKTIEELAVNPEGVLALQVAFAECRAPAERANAAWSIGGAALLLVVTGVIFWLLPTWKIRRSKLTLLSARDAPDVVAYLEQLCREAGLTRPPTFLWNPLNPVNSAIAFGRPGRYCVALNGGLVTRFYTDQPAFRAIMLHELAHLRNADVSKTYFAVAAWQGFVIAGLVPFTLCMFVTPLGAVLNLSWRVLALTVVVFLMRNAVLRTREVYADVRASVWDGPMGAIRRVLQALPVPQATHWRSALRLHPDPEERCRVLDDTSQLFRMGFWVAFGTGVVAMIVAPSVVTFLASLLTGVPQSGLEVLGGVLVFAPLAAGVVGLGAWRATFAALAQGRLEHGAGWLGIGLGLGVIAGRALSFTGTGYVNVLADQTPELPFVSVLLEFFWGALLLAGLVLFVWWIVAGASAWLEVAAAHRSPRPTYIVDLTIASLWLAVWLGFLISAHELGLIALRLLTFDPISVVWSVVQHPFTILMMLSLWAFPLAAWLWRARTSSVTDASWAFLDSAPRPLALPRQMPLRPGLAFTTALVGGVGYCGLLLVIRIALRLTIPEAQRSSDDFILNFFVGTIALAALMQTGVAVVTAMWVRRLGWVHGLFAAFVAGCVMTVGILGLNLLFGGTLDPTFVWNVFSQVVNEGALLALPFVLIVSALSGRLLRP
jgi:Zn-dependent protease with chaperone function